MWRTAALAALAAAVLDAGTRQVSARVWDECCSYDSCTSCTYTDPFCGQRQHCLGACGGSGSMWCADGAPATTQPPPSTGGSAQA